MEIGFCRLNALKLELDKKSNKDDVINPALPFKLLLSFPRTDEMINKEERKL